MTTQDDKTRQSWKEKEITQPGWWGQQVDRWGIAGSGQKKNKCSQKNEMKPPQTVPTLDGLIHQSSTQPATTWFFIFMNTQEWQHVTSRMCAACGLISSPSASWCRLPRGSSAAGVAPTQLLMLLNGPGRRWCSCKFPSINKWKENSWLLFESHLPGSSFKTNSVNHWNRPGICFRWGSAAPLCLVLWNLMGWCRLWCISADVPNSNPIFPHFCSCSHFHVHIKLFLEL